MTIITSIVLGIIEGLTEFLPVSSTGHLILAGKFLALPATEFVKSFDIIIQLGAILAVVALYWRKLLINREILKRVIVAFIPTGLIGLALYKVVKLYLLGNEQVVLISLFLGGVIIIVFELWHKEKETDLQDLEKLSYLQALGLGVFQSLAIIPGVSRSAATIIGGLTLRLKREAIVEFSFLLAVPTMAAATGLDILKSSMNFSLSEVSLLSIGFIVSFLVALLAIKTFILYIQKNNFIVFGIYRILVSLAFAWLLLF